MFWKCFLLIWSSVLLLKSLMWFWSLTLCLQHFSTKNLTHIDESHNSHKWVLRHPALVLRWAFSLPYLPLRVFYTHSSFPHVALSQAFVAFQRQTCSAGMLLTINTSFESRSHMCWGHRSQEYPSMNPGHAFCWEVEHYDHYSEAAAGWILLHYRLVLPVVNFGVSGDSWFFTCHCFFPVGSFFCSHLLQLSLPTLLSCY